METLTARKQIVLDAIDEQIAELEEKLKKAQPLMNELNQLRATRRTLLSERGTTSGGGRPDTLLTMEMVVHFLTENGPSTPQEITDGLGVPGQSVRSHLNRHKGTRYMRNDNGLWGLTEGNEVEDEEEEDE